MRCQLESPECRGRLEWHHAIKQQRIRREFKWGAWARPQYTLPGPGAWVPAHRSEPVTRSHATALTLDDILGDTRNRVWLCSFHHEKVTNGRLKVELPESVWEFAREHGLEAQLENDIARAA